MAPRQRGKPAAAAAAVAASDDDDIDDVDAALPAQKRQRRRQQQQQQQQQQQRRSTAPRTPPKKHAGSRSRSSKSRTKRAASSSSDDDDDGDGNDDELPNDELPTQLPDGRTHDAAQLKSLVAAVAAEPSSASARLAPAGWRLFPFRRALCATDGVSRTADPALCHPGLAGWFRSSSGAKAYAAAARRAKLRWAPGLLLGGAGAGSSSSSSSSGAAAPSPEDEARLRGVLRAIKSFVAGPELPVGGGSGRGGAARAAGAGAGGEAGAPTGGGAGVSAGAWVPPPAAAAAAPPPPPPGRSAVLCLGMVFAAAGAAEEDYGEGSAAFRDRARLLELERPSLGLGLNPSGPGSGGGGSAGGGSSKGLGSSSNNNSSGNNSSGSSSSSSSSSSGGYAVFTLDRDHGADAAEPHRHAQGSFLSARGARAVAAAHAAASAAAAATAAAPSSSSEGLQHRRISGPSCAALPVVPAPGVVPPIRAVLLDYFRMPAGYASAVYRPALFTEFIPALARSPACCGSAADEDDGDGEGDGDGGGGLLVYVPNAPELLAQLSAAGALRGYEAVARVGGGACPLFAATARAEARGALPPGYGNASQTESLEPARPFVVLRYRGGGPAGGGGAAGGQERKRKRSSGGGGKRRSGGR